MNIPIFKRLHVEGHISDATLRQVEDQEASRPFSLHWELTLLLYLGVVLLTGGLGVLVYKNIDTIGHQAVLACIGLVTAGSFFYCLRKKAPFSWNKASATDPFFDYVLLLGCLSLLIFLGYLQYAYAVFGDHYGMATFIPMVILFFTAYYFDQAGVLSLAITNLAAWVGIAITPLSILHSENFASTRLTYTGALLAVLLMAAGHLSLRRQLKAHFEPTYTNFGLHLFFIAALAGLFTSDEHYLIWLIPLIAGSYYLFIRAIARRSFYFVVMIVLYAYIGISYVIIWLLSTMGDLAVMLLYLVLSAILIAVLLVRINRKMKSDDSL